MLQVYLFLAYVMFGAGFSIFIADENPRAKEWSNARKYAAFYVMWITWPVWPAFMLGAKVAEVLQ